MSPKRAQHTPLPRLVVISAPSGAGKTTLSSLLLKEFPLLQRSVSTTTRPKRDNEIEGTHYHFVDDITFRKKITLNHFAEWALVHGNKYGTTRANIESILLLEKHPVFDIDVQGAMNLKALYGDRVLLIFIHPPSLEALKERLIQRKDDSLSSIENRLQNATSEIGWSQKYDYQVTNDLIEKSFLELKNIVFQECFKRAT
ncbi:MAG: guanylate kinase [Bdellovibrionales bacterium]|nr:guanylate kinase [Bdellovibrionales bacterium]